MRRSKHGKSFTAGLGREGDLLDLSWKWGVGTREWGVGSCREKGKGEKELVPHGENNWPVIAEGRGLQVRRQKLRKSRVSTIKNVLITFVVAITTEPKVQSTSLLTFCLGAFLLLPYCTRLSHASPSLFPPSLQKSLIVGRAVPEGGWCS